MSVSEKRKQWIDGMTLEEAYRNRDKRTLSGDAVTYLQNHINKLERENTQNQQVFDNHIKRQTAVVAWLALVLSVVSLLVSFFKS